MKEYKIGDIIAIKLPREPSKGISCKVKEDGVGETLNGNLVEFEPEDVLWVRGLNGKWPNWVFAYFRGEGADSNEASVGDSGEPHIG